MAPPPFSSRGGLILTMMVAFGLAEDDADSIQSNRGDDVVDLHGGRDLQPRQAPDAEVPKRSDPSFVVDSAASDHATSDRRFLSGLVADDIAAGILRRGGRELPIAGVGAIASDKFQLPRVLYAPDLPPGTVLVSVQQLAASGYLVMFGGGRCVVSSESGGKVVGEGSLGDDGLYYLQFLNIPLNDIADSTV